MSRKGKRRSVINKRGHRSFGRFLQAPVGEQTSETTLLKPLPTKPDVFSDPNCIFSYCPNPETCKEKGCIAQRSTGGDQR
jgi:hypothetical protein